VSDLIDQVSHLHLLGVAMGAGLGAILRAGVDRTIVRRFGSTRLPWATLTVNVAGSLLLGLVLALDSVALFAATSAEAAEAARTLHLVVGTGFCGGLTTFSTYSVESFLLLQERRGRAAVGYAVLTMGLGMAAVVLGTAIGDAVG
jgi:fluoride exporter